MSEPYDPEAILADPNAPDVHKKIAAINIRVRDLGESWHKCANCGQLYVLVTEVGQAIPTLIFGDRALDRRAEEKDLWTDTTVCSQSCWDAYLAYISDPGGA